MDIYFYMVKLKRKEEEKKRFIILQELEKKKSIFQISNEIGCGSATVARVKKSYENYLLKINYNKAKNKERLDRDDANWKREKKEESFKGYFNGFPLTEKIRKRKTSIPYKIRLYIYRKCKDKNTGGQKGMFIGKVRVAANKKFKKVLTKTLTSSSISRFLKKNSKDCIH